MTTEFSMPQNGEFPDVNALRDACVQANKEHRSELEQHRGILGLLDTLLTVLASLVVFYPVVYGFQKWFNVQYSFFKTDTCKIQDEFDEMLGLTNN
ncbi:MAG: hypothetical protein H0U70_04700 [Tatlockia sp.]|nr:hypothetical protein [Tatlockia sp.]